MNTATYNAVWDGLLQVSYARQYYYEQEKKLHVRVHALRGALGISACGAVACLFVAISWLGPACGFAMACLVIVDFHWGGTLRLSQVQSVNMLVQRLEADYRHLWERVRRGDLEDQYIHAEKDILMKRLIDITVIADVSPDEKIRHAAQENAFATEAARYAA